MANATICKYCITRRAGLPKSILADTDLTLGKLADERRRSRADLLKRERQLGDGLTGIIARMSGDEKVACIQLRRDVFNRRTTRVERTIAENPGLLRELLPLWQALQGDRQRLADLEQQYRALIPTWAEARLSYLTATFRTSDAAKALALSSPQFWDRLSGEHIEVLSERGLSQTAAKLLTYISRAAAKTSPLSFFCTISFSRIEPGSGQTVIRAPRLVESQALLNTQYALQQVERITANAESILRWNTSLSLTGQGLLWMFQHQDIDVIRSAVIVAGADAFRPLLAVEGALSGTGPLPEVAALTEEQRCSYLRAGLLLEQKVAPSRVAQLIDPFQPDPMPEKLLSEEDALVGRFKVAPTAERIAIIQQLAVSCVKEPSRPANDPKPGVVDGNPPRFSRSMLSTIREDVIAKDVVSLDQGQMEATVHALRAFQRNYHSFAGPHDSLLRLGWLLREWFPGRSTVPLLEFSNRLFGEARKADESENQRTRLTELLGRICPGKELLRVNRRALDSLRQLVDTQRDSDPSTFVSLDPYHGASPTRLAEEVRGLSSALLQFGGRDLAVVNGLGLGCGCGARRFFNYNRAFWYSYRDWLKVTLDDQGLDILILDDIFFHPDIAPRLFDQYFEIPGLRVVDPTLAAFPLRNCVVTTNCAGSAELRTAAGRPVHAHYDSLLTLRQRPFFTQLLILFSRPGWGFNLESFSARLLRGRPAKTGKSDRSKHFPRLTLAGRTVLSRESWMIAAGDTPALPGSAGLATIVSAYQDWASDMALPARVYVRSLKAFESNRKKIGATTDDNYKPHYIDFNDPTWVLAFHKYVCRCEGDILIQEALPDPATIGDESVSEHYVQWAL